MTSRELKEIEDRASCEDPTAYHDLRKAQEDRQRLLEYVRVLRRTLDTMTKEDLEP